MTPQLKICERCGVAQPATTQYFGIGQRINDPLKPYCLTCAPDVIRERRKHKNEVSRTWAAANREKVRESDRRSRERNGTDRRAYFKKYREQNREQVNASARAYQARKRQEREANA